MNVRDEKNDVIRKVKISEFTKNMTRMKSLLRVHENKTRQEKALFSIATREYTPSVEKYRPWIHEQSLHAFL